VLGSAKAAMESLVRSFAVELAPKGIRVNGVNPGFIETDSARTYAASTGVDWDLTIERIWLPKIPAARLGSADEVASVIAFLCSPAANYVYGQTLLVDGGLTLS
jgi:enoyl-[acyl-carrier protein] reductase III